MNIPSFGQPQNPDPYVIPQPGQDKKKTTLLMFGGLAIVVILLAMMIFGGKSAGGQADMLSVMNQTGSALGAIKTYGPKAKNSTTQTHLSVINILLSGNYNTLGTLYKKTYDKKKKFLSSPVTDPATAQKLDAAVKNDTLDSEIISILKPKITIAQRSLLRAKPNFTGPSSSKTINTAITDYQSISDILNKDR